MPPESFLSDFRGHFILAHLHLLFNYLPVLILISFHFEKVYSSPFTS